MNDDDGDEDDAARFVFRARGRRVLLGCGSPVGLSIRRSGRESNRDRFRRASSEIRSRKPRSRPRSSAVGDSFDIVRKILGESSVPLTSFEVGSRTDEISGSRAFAELPATLAANRRGRRRRRRGIRFDFGSRPLGKSVHRKEVFDAIERENRRNGIGPNTA